MIVDFLKSKLIELGLPAEQQSRISSAPIHLNSAGFDPWGMDPETVKWGAAAVRWLYTHYFRVEVVGIENIPQGRVVLASNHSGQLPVDGLLIVLALLFEANPSRIARAMLERWVPALPFISSIFSRFGEVVGDPRNCRELLNNNEAVLVFPEGVRGLGKSIFKRYQLQKF